MRSIRGQAAALLLASVALSGCGGSSDTSADPADSATPETTSASASPSDTASASSSESASVTPSPAFRGVSIDATFSGGKVSPPTHRVQVDEGQRVRLTVTSDVAEEVHVHGFDKSKDLEPGVPGTLTFRADQSGLFEVELEEHALQIVQLEVR